MLMKNDEIAEHEEMMKLKVDDLSDQYCVEHALAELARHLRRFVYFENLGFYLVVAAFICLTHCFELFPVIPYLYITGPPGSGKSTLLMLLYFLCYESVLASQLTKAALIKVVHLQRATLLVDETESLGRFKQNDFSYSILNSGNKQYIGNAIQIDPRDRKLVQLNTFSPKAFASTETPRNKPFETRCIFVSMTENEEHYEILDPAQHKYEFDATKERLEYLFQNESVKNIIKNNCENLMRSGQYRGRSGELQLGLQAILHSIENKKIKNWACLTLQNFFEKQKVHAAEKIFFEDWKLQTLFYIREYLKEKSYHTGKFIPVKELTECVSKRVSSRYKLTNRSVRKALNFANCLVETRVRRVERGSKRVPEACYNIHKEALSKFMKKFERFIEPSDTEEEIESYLRQVDRWEKKKQKENREKKKLLKGDLPV